MKEENPYDSISMSVEARARLERSKDSLFVPEGYFETHAAMLESTLQEWFETPDRFFDTQAAELERLCVKEKDATDVGRAMDDFRATNARMGEWSERAGGVVGGIEVGAEGGVEGVRGMKDNPEERELENKPRRIIRLLVAVAAAAAVVGLLITVLPVGEESPSFARQLEQAELEFEDLEELELDESLYEELIIADTIAPDTSAVDKVTSSMDEFKPSAGQGVINWDDITVEDIQEYLKEEESLNIIDEL